MLPGRPFDYMMVIVDRFWQFNQLTEKLLFFPNPKRQQGMTRIGGVAL